MTVDINVWRQRVKEVVEGIADEALQRRAWFGAGPEEYTPAEAVEMFFGNAAMEEFLARADNGLDDAQTAAGWRLFTLMDSLTRGTKAEHWTDPSYLIDEPRWKVIRAAAAEFAKAF
jgi:hypothetical protein